MNTNAYYMLSFESTHAAMAWEKALSGRVPVRTMPTLRQVSASCGISLRVEAEDLPALLVFLREGPRPEPAARTFYVEGGIPAPYSLS